MNNINSVPHFARALQFVESGMKTALTAAAVIIAIAAALLGDGRHSSAYADDPSPTAAHISQSSDESSQSLRRYTLRMLRILSDGAANKWARYWQAKAHCDVAPTQPDYLSAGGNVSRFDFTLASLNERLCDGLDQRLDVNPVDYPPLAVNRTVGLFLNEPESMSGYILLTGRFNNYVHLIDHIGRIAHSWKFEKRIVHAKLLDNGNLLITIRQDDGKRTIAEVDPLGNVIWEYAHPDRLHHDFLKMPNGNVLILAQGFKTREEAIAAGANPDVVPLEGMEYDYLIEVRPTGSEGGEIVWEWSAWDYIAQDFDPTKPNYGAPSDHPELIDINFLVETPTISRLSDAWNWLHINTIDYNSELDQIALSPRQYSELWIIDRDGSAEEASTRSGGNTINGNTPPPPIQMY